jgi:hypothetical protein
MGEGSSRRYRAGDKVDDLCRACKLVREHTVQVAAPDGTPVRVVCDWCMSHHNFRGGGPPKSRSLTAGTAREATAQRDEPFPTVSERERSEPTMSDPQTGGVGTDLEMLLRRIIREESGLTPVVPAERWRGGELVLRPGREGVQEKNWPIETFFHKVVMLRNRLRVLEQQINGSELSDDQKVKLQSYVTACYGSLTSFNILFARDEDRFRGSGSRD